MKVFIVLGNLMQLVATLNGCSVAICDKVKPSAEGGIQAVIEFVTKRGNELDETDISRSSMTLMLFFFEVRIFV